MNNNYVQQANSFQHCSLNQINSIAEEILSNPAGFDYSLFRITCPEQELDIFGYICDKLKYDKDHKNKIDEMRKTLKNSYLQGIFNMKLVCTGIPINEIFIDNGDTNSHIAGLANLIEKMKYNDSYYHAFIDDFKQMTILMSKENSETFNTLVIKSICHATTLENFARTTNKDFLAALNEGAKKIKLSFLPNDTAVKLLATELNSKKNINQCIKLIQEKSHNRVSYKTIVLAILQSKQDYKEAIAFVEKIKNTDIKYSIYNAILRNPYFFEQYPKTYDMFLEMLSSEIKLPHWFSYIHVTAEKKYYTVKHVLKYFSRSYTENLAKHICYMYCENKLDKDLTYSLFFEDKDIRNKLINNLSPADLKKLSKTIKRNHPFRRWFGKYKKLLGKMNKAIEAKKTRFIYPQNPVAGEWTESTPPTQTQNFYYQQYQPQYNLYANPPFPPQESNLENPYANL